MIPANTRLGIPARVPGRLAGRRRQRLDRRHPVGRHLGAGLDLGHRRWRTAYGQAYGAEQAGKGHNVALGADHQHPAAPLWGRAPETFSEDPYLTGNSRPRLRSTGIQSQHVIATAKHFVANNQEVCAARSTWSPRQRDARTRSTSRRSDGRPAGAGSAPSCAPTTGSTARTRARTASELTDTLREAWHFDGMVMSDWGALHSTVQAARSRAGPGDARRGRRRQPRPDRPVLRRPTSTASSRRPCSTGAVPMADARRHGHATSSPRCSASGCSTIRLPDPATVKDTVRQHARRTAPCPTRIADQGTVLLKNAGPALPLRHRTRCKSIAVIGDAACKHPQTAAGGSAAVLPSQPVVTPLAGITARAGSGRTVTYAAGHARPRPAAGRPGQRLRHRPDRDLLRAAPTSPGAGRHRDRRRTSTITGNPAAGRSSLPTWSARYTGTLTAPADGDYRFSLQAGGYVTRRHRRPRGRVNYPPMPRAVTQNGLVAPDRRRRTPSGSRSRRSCSSW